MEFMTREDDQKEPITALIKLGDRNGPERVEQAKEDLDDFLTDQEALLEEQEYRVYKQRCKDAMNALTKQKTASFQETYERHRKNQETLKALRDGTLEPEYQVDGAKVAYTVGIQLANLSLFIALVGIGYWPVALLTVPAILGYNYHWLDKQRSA